jgi:hypothetical protein
MFDRRRHPARRVGRAWCVTELDGIQKVVAKDESHRPESACPE